MPLAEGVGWSRGTDIDYLTELVAYWTETYYWREHESASSTIRGSTPAPATRDCGRSTRPADPGHRPWSCCTAGPTRSCGSSGCCRCSPTSTSSCRACPATRGPCRPTRRACRRQTWPTSSPTPWPSSGIDRYVVSGGDIGSSVAENISPRRTPAPWPRSTSPTSPTAHLFTVDADELTEAERDYIGAGAAWQMAEGAYALEQATKPHTLAAALGDSPAGLLPGSWRSSAPGVTAAAMSSRSSPATTC